jgi:lipoate-protein ligase B
VPYEHALEIQRGMLDQRKRGEILDTLLLLEHPHVYTLGRRAVREHVLASPDVLQAMGAKVVETDRGGEVTYHGPGQLVGYPIMSIREAGLGPVSYVRILEQTVIDTLRLYGVSGHRVVGKTGVWVGGEPGAKPPHGQNPAGQKVSAIGVRVSAGVAMHGFALNVSTDLAYFSHIVPCGMPHLETASIASLTGASPATREVATQVARHLAGHLQRQLRWTASDSLAA